MLCLLRKEKARSGNKYNNSLFINTGPKDQRKINLDLNVFRKMIEKAFIPFPRMYNKITKIIQNQSAYFKAPHNF